MRGSRLYIVGAGGFGREVADVVEAINGEYKGTWNLEGVFDDAPSQKNLERLRQRQISYLGPVPTECHDPDSFFVIGIGSPNARSYLARDLDQWGWTAAQLVHPSADIGSSAQIGPGTVVCAGVQLSTNVISGRHVHVNSNATIGHDAILGDFVSVNPGAIISGEVNVGTETLIGAGAVVLQGVSTGYGVTVGAAACVIKSVEDRDTVVGVPARPIRGAK